MTGGDIANIGIYVLNTAGFIAKVVLFLKTRREHGRRMARLRRMDPRRE